MRDCVQVRASAEFEPALLAIRDEPRPHSLGKNSARVLRDCVGEDVVSRLECTVGGAGDELDRAETLAAELTARDATEAKLAQLEHSLSSQQLSDVAAPSADVLVRRRVPKRHCEEPSGISKSILVLGAKKKKKAVLNKDR